MYQDSILSVRLKCPHTHIFDNAQCCLYYYYTVWILIAVGVHGKGEGRNPIPRRYHQFIIRESWAYINGTMVQVDTDVRSKYGSGDGNRWKGIETWTLIVTNQRIPWPRGRNNKSKRLRRSTTTVAGHLYVTLSLSCPWLLSRASNTVQLHTLTHTHVYTVFRTW